MGKFWRLIAAALVLLGPASLSRGVELTISRDALERTLKQDLFNGPDGRYYLKGNAKAPCFISTEDPQLRFEQDRIVVRVKTRARLGVGGVCLATVTLPAEVSMEPDAEGRDDRVQGREPGQGFGPERNQLCSGAVSRGQVPKSMKVNAADLLRAALAGSTASSGYKVSLGRLKILSIQIVGDKLVVEADGDLSVE